LAYHFRKSGSTGAAYNNIVAGGANACILHYDTNDHVLKDGDLLLIDAGCEWEYYAADVTRTFPVNGRFSPEQRALYEVVLSAEKQAIAAIAPGVPCLKIHEVAQRVVCEGLIDLGLLQGTVEENLKAGHLSRFFMHGTGHWLGLDVHDVGVYSTATRDRRAHRGRRAGHRRRARGAHRRLPQGSRRGRGCLQRRLEPGRRLLRSAPSGSRGFRKAAPWE
jgi:Xaa-Pro aminopeptidase